MSWKSYAAVSAATVMAGWAASLQPSNSTTSGVPAQSETSAVVPGAAADIEQQAARLQAGLRQHTGYREAERNPFRFVAEPAAGNAVDSRAAAPPPEFVSPPPPLITLAGIAADQVGERTERTAILSSPSGVLLVREGDEVVGRYRVVTIDNEAVELIGLADGARLRLTF